MEFIMQTALAKAKENQISDADLRIGTANIKVFGVGGGGSNAASWLHRKGIKGADVVICNT
ncbi:MAG: cell division protein FtsZ, partial [Candidatus Nanoarchaeia archaeon]|nr:cell division protein FtsZ [Candidatus Nanoarchaeia archaeon]